MTTATRIIGLDVARGLAIVGMFAAHVAPTEGEQLWDGRSSVLFATLAGVSIGLMSGGARPGGRRIRTTLSIVLRGVLLLLLGVMLIALGTPIAVILPHYGLMFVLAAVFLYAPRWLLAALVGVFALAGPVVVTAISVAAPAYLQTLEPVESAWASEVVTWLTLYYPVPSWLAYLTVGLLLARCDVRSARTQAWMIVGGTVAAVAGYAGGRALGGPTLVEAHSSTTFELLGAGGVAVAVAGSLCWLCGSAPSPIRTIGGRALTPVAAIGAMPLTVYTLHLVLLAVYLQAFPNVYDFTAWRSWTLLAGFIFGAMAFALLWTRVLRQGPLEWLFARITLRPVRA
ncbi:DUF418 domain-containing protein [Microbacteriaceae bacterium VKM Ac-2855]|nr:DUF418 domain-containing protein [Microbacteriaceae bacterium VKM Ac-2855]